MKNTDTLFDVAPLVRQRGSFMVRNLRMVSDVVCEAPSEILSTPEDTVRFMQDAWDGFCEKEQVWVVFLNNRNRPLGRQLLTVGTDNKCLISSRDVLRSVLIAGAASFVVLHNHPSGDPAPSAADTAVTRQLRAAAEVVDVRFHDHIVVGDLRADPSAKGFFSYRLSGML